MKSKGGNTARRNEDALAKRYGRIGISAVAAAARYQGKARNEASSQTKQADKVGEREGPHQNADHLRVRGSSLPDSARPCSELSDEQRAALVSRLTRPAGS